MNDTPESRNHSLLKVVFTLFFIGSVVSGIISYSNIANKANAKAIIEKQLDAEYVKGFNAALDCRALLSAPACEVVLEKAGK